MIITFSASSYGWMITTLGISKIGGNTIPIQIMGEWGGHGNLTLIGQSEPAASNAPIDRFVH